MTGVHLRSVVAGIRGLGRAGVRVVALGPSRHAAGLRSRYAAAAAVGPDPVTAGAGFAQRVTELAREHAPVVVYPGQEAAIDALLAGSPAGPLNTAYGDEEGLQAIRDKGRLPELAAESGLRTPETLALASASEMLATPPRFPCVFKPVRPGGALRRTALVADAAESARLLRQLPHDEPVLVQERLSGPLRAVALVVDGDGAVMARFEQIARRTFPADAGISSEAVSVAPDDALIGRAAGMLRLAGYRGLAQLQFVETPSGPRLIDVNPRFYGSLPLALAAGVNLPAAWHAMVTGGAVPPPAPYRVGVTFRWLESDVVAAAKGDLRVLLRRAPAPRVGAVWTRDDALPGLVLGTEAMVRRVGKLARRLREG